MTNNITLKYKHLFWLFALATALIFDQLFWGNPFGVNFFIFIAIALLSGLIPMWVSKIQIPWASYLLLLPVVVFSVFTFIRSEPLTTVMNVLITFGSLILFTISLRNGEWFRYDFRDHLINLLKFMLNSMIGGILFFTKIKTGKKKQKKDHATDENEGPVGENTNQKSGRPYLRGLLLALPVIILFSLLLAAADPVFGARVFGIFNWFNFDQLGEFTFRLIYILLIAYLLMGAYFFGLEQSATHNKTHDTSAKRHLIGTIEASVILGAVNLLFLSFVLIQFAYLFGGDQNVTIEGFTYAEYARRGFFELLAVAIISGILFYTLSQVTERKSKSHQWIFKGLSLTLIVLVGIMLVSAYTRLALYEAAYGFTRLRTFTHIFIIWTGVALLALGVLEVTKKMRRLPFILILLLLLFGLTVNSLNIDRFIVHQNIQRAMTQTAGNIKDRLDTAYLSGLSFDAIPPLTAYYQDESTPEDLQTAIGGVLACRMESADLTEQIPWTSWHYARSKAFSKLEDLDGELANYQVYRSEEPWGRFVDIRQVTFPCSSGWD